MQNERNQDTITAGELMDRQFFPRSVIVDGFLPAGTYILAGAPKCGKSFLMTQLCWCVAEGHPFLGFPTKQSEVLYLALEDTEERLQNRLNRMFEVDWTGDRFHLKFRTELQGEMLVDSLNEFVFEHPDTRLIVIDTLQRVRALSGNASHYGSDYDTILPFKSFTDSHDLTLILVHHTRKNTEDENPFNQISGTNGLLGAADGGFVLHSKGGEMLLDYTGRDLPAQQYGLLFHRGNCLWELLRVGKPVIPEPPDPLMEQIDRILNSNWVGTATELLQELQKIDESVSYTPNSLSRRLNHLTARLEREKGILYFKSRRSEERSITLIRRGNDDNDDKNSAEEIPSLPSSLTESILE